MTIAGQSGSGKSLVLEQLKRDFINLNKVDFEILSFEFEMLIEDQLTRYVASENGKTLKELYSASGPLGDEDFSAVEDLLNKKNEQPIFYVDNAGTPDQIGQLIMQFALDRQLLEKNLGLVVTIDHVLLTKGKDGQQEKERIDTLMEVLNEIKKHFAHIGLRCLIICLGQLNRDIERPERVDNPLYHFPTRNDIFAASSIYHTSDYVMITHRPATINGIKKGYGPSRTKFPDGYPLKYPKDENRQMIYWHIIKERFGKLGVIALAENFKYSKLEEVDI